MAKIEMVVDKRPGHLAVCAIYGKIYDIFVVYMVNKNEETLRLSRIHL